MSSPRISLGENDVLLGRGAGARERKGNRQFLSIVQQYKEVWALTTTRKEKLAVAHEVLNRVKAQSPPGRFLEPSGDTHSDELWHEVDETKVIGKIKQALREPPAQKVAPSQSTVPTPGSQRMAFPQTGAHLLGTAPASLLMPGQASLMAHGMHAGLNSFLRSDPSLQYRLAAHEAVARTLPMVMSNTQSVPIRPTTSLSPATTPLPFPSALCQSLVSAGNAAGSPFGQPVSNIFSMQQQKEPPLTTRQEQLSKSPETQACSPHTSQPSEPEKKCALYAKPSASAHEKGEKKDGNGKRPLKKRSYTGATGIEEKERENKEEKEDSTCLDSSHPTSTSSLISTRTDSGERIDSEDVEAAQFLLSTMSESVRQALAVVQQQDQQITEEDRDQAMIDMFGALCEINQSKKRMKMPPERSDSLESLLQEMRREIDAVPSYEKLAMLEAREAASKVEFSDRHLERFLRRENMNAEKAARRFVTYWEERRKLFGPEKFLLPMTLKGALRDDHECLKHGPLFAAPAIDTSGRILGGYILKRQFGESYDSQSVIRVFWFYSELSAKHPNAADGVVKYMNIADASIFDFDFDFMRTTSNLEKIALPVPIRGTHVCCVPRMVLASTFIKPMAYSRIDKDSRIRVAIHDCPPVQTADKLKEYGIPAHVVPKEMGGTCDFDVEHDKWLAQLRKLDEKHALESDEFVWWEL